MLHRGINILAVTAILMALVSASIVLFPLPLQALDCGGVPTSIIGGEICAGADKESKDSSENPVVSILVFVMQILTGLVGVAAVGALVYAGVMYGSAGGNSGQVEKAKTMITNTVLGLVLYGGMILLLNWIIPGGVFGQMGVTGSGSSSGSGGGSNDSSEDDTEGSSTDGSGINPDDKKTGKKSTVVTIATWNVLYNNGSTDVKNGAKKIGSAGADLIGFQELNFPASRKAIKDALINCDGCAYSGYFPGSSDASGWNAPSTVSVVWNKNMFTKLDQGQIHVSKADGQANTGNKWITWVKLKDKKTQVTFYFANTHLVAKVGPSKKEPKRIGDNHVKQNYYNHIKKLSDFVGGKKQPVFIAGDFNIAYDYDAESDHKYDGKSYSPKRALKKYDLYSNWEYAKKSSGSIDYIWAPKRNNVEYVSMKRWSNKLGSDHAPVQMTIKVYEE